MIYEGEKSCDSGCSGGLQPNAFTYIIKTGGIDTESSYPYEGILFLLPVVWITAARC